MIGHPQSTLEPHGPIAQDIAGLTWYLLAVLTIAYLITMAMLALALLRSRRGQRASESLSRNVVIAWGVAIPFVVLTSVLFYSMAVGRTLSPEPFKDQMTIQVDGKQFWWSVRYFRGSDMIARTANEIHLPVNTPVRLKLTSNDVIHSFWAPNLSGKMDLIPGRTNETWLRMDKEGVVRGECAEFCGAQHAHMSFEVIAEPADKFYRWLDWQAKPAAVPADGQARRGHDVFTQGPCVVCHAVRGTIAGATAGPDLTHFGGRRTIGAATLPNTRDHLARWIHNAQEFKPGTRMPRLDLPEPDVQALVTYLETLK